MVPNLFFYQLVLVALVWLCVMLHWAWPSDCATAPLTPSQLTPPRYKRRREPKPFAGVTHKPHCDACAHAGEPRSHTPLAPRVVKKPEASFLAAVIPQSATRLSCFLMGAGADWPLETLQPLLPLGERHLLQRTPALPTAAARSPRGRLGRTPRVAHRRPAADACAATYRSA
jgi:hypothetical protein